MYTDFYQFREKPFDQTPDIRFFYQSSVHKRALAYLIYGLTDKKGFITISGEIGAGKTTLIRQLMNSLNKNAVVAHITNPKLPPLELLQMILHDFGIENQYRSKVKILNEFNKFLLEQYACGKDVMLIIDEAQVMDVDTLEEIRLLSNLETEKEKLLQIVLAGQPELRNKLNVPELKQLRQRIAVGYHILPLNAEETWKYIKHRLHVAGGRNDYFAEETRDQIYKFSTGIPRLINMICDAALLAGYVEEKRIIDNNLISDVVEELDLDVERVKLKASERREGVTGDDCVKITGKEEARRIDEIEKELNQISQKVKWLYDRRIRETGWEKVLLAKEKEIKRLKHILYKKEQEIIEREKSLVLKEGDIKAKEEELLKLQQKLETFRIHIP